MIARPLILPSLLALAFAAPAAAQVTAEIVADTIAGLATGTSITNAGAITTIDGGVRAGGNLFHSFTTFNLAQGATARWIATNPGAVSNVVNRVTGGFLSTIAGTIDSTALPNADFYFINPAGVLFTTGARLNVPGAAHFSTGADGVRFADGAKFSALEPNGAFSMAAPQSFGFLGFEGNIIVSGVGDTFVPINTRLSFTAANVGVQGSTFVPLTFDVAATGEQARSVSLADPLGGAPLGGLALLIDSRIFTSATGQGVRGIRVGADSFAQVGGFLTSSTVFSGDAGDLLIRANSVDITGLVASNAGELVTTGNAGTVAILASSVRVGDAGQVTSSTFGAGNAGNVVIIADTLLVESQGSVGSDTLGANTTGRGGRVDINVGGLTVRDEGAISSSTNGRGDAGSVNVTADRILIDGGGISSVALAGTGHGGLVTIEAGELELRNKGGISSASFTAGDAGSIRINAGTVRATGLSGISSFSSGAGAAGSVTIDASNLTVDGSIIFSDTFGSGRAGNVTIRATNLTLVNSVLSSDTEGSGSAGDVSLTATRLTLSDDSLITSSTKAAGAGGQVSITADQAQLDFSEIRSQANAGSSGAAGNLVLNVGQLNATNQTVISSSTFGAGDAGQLSINVGRLSATNQTAISSSTFGAGDAGLLSITAQDIALESSVIVSRAIEDSQGNAGQVVIRTGTLALTNQSSVSSATFASGDAGGVTITAARISVDNSAIESAAGIGSTGNGGVVKVTADDLTLRNFGQLATSALGAGNAGQVQVSAGQVSITGGSLMASRARGAATGAAGSVTVGAKGLTLLSGGQIETSSQNPNTAGDIRLAIAGPITISGADSHIASENLSAAGGAAGSINIAGFPILLAEGGSISTNAVTGPAGDIALFLPSDSLLRLEGRGAPGVITTSSGPGTGGRIIIYNPLAVISNGGRILALGQAQGANVQIRSDFFIRAADRLNQLSVDGDLVLDSQVSDVSAGAAIPDVSFLDASGVLRGQCPAARSGGITSQLSLRPFGPYTADPIRMPSLASEGAAPRLGGCS